VHSGVSNAPLTDCMWPVRFVQPSLSLSLSLSVADLAPVTKCGLFRCLKIKFNKEPQISVEYRLGGRCNRSGHFREDQISCPVQKLTTDGPGGLITLVNTQNVSATKIDDSSSIQRAETKYGLRIQFLALVVMKHEVWLNAYNSYLGRDTGVSTARPDGE